MPNCLSTLRATSTTVTRSITWSLPRIVTELITAPLAALNRPPETPTKALAMSVACCASELDDTTPVIRIESPAGLISSTAFGSALLRVWRRTLRSRPTETSSAAIWRPSASMTKIEVAPFSMPIRKSLRVERTTAFATFGLATKTSFASRGRSTTSERPIDRSMRRAIACSFGPTSRTGAAATGPFGPTSRASAGARNAGARNAGVMPATSKPILVFAVLRRVDPIRQPFLNSERLFTASAIAWRRLAHHRQRALSAIGARRVLGLVGVGEAAQGEREVADLLRQRDHLGLGRSELERCGLAGDDLLAVALLDVLPDRKHADVGQDGLRHVHVDAAGAGGFVVAERADDVDAVVRQDEAAGRASAAGVDRHRDGAHAGRQDRRQEARAVGLDQLLAPDRLAAEEAAAGERARGLLDAVREFASPDERARRAVRRPRHPAQVGRLEVLPHRDVG